MFGKQRFMIKFFVTHLCLTIPVLLVSIFITAIVSGRMRLVEDEKVEQQLSNAVSNFQNLYTGYYNESVILSERSELLPNKMLTNAMEAYNGIELLKLKQSFDNRITDILLEYGTEYVYSSALSRKRVYLESNGYREESIVRSFKAMERGEEGAIVLFKSDKNGSFMLTYPIQRGGKQWMSVNFILPFEQMMLFFRPTDSGQWFLLEAWDGSILALGCDKEGETIVLAPEEYERRLMSQDYQVFETNDERAGLTIRIYYEKIVFDLNQGFYQMQCVNIALILLGGILSAMLSWGLSRKRMKEIVRLESIAQGEGRNFFTEKNVYNRLQNIIVHSLDTKQELELKELANVIRFRDRTVGMIFRGFINNKEELDVAFKELGWKKGYPDCFFVGAISVKGQLLDSQLPPFLKECLLMYMSRDAYNIVVFLYELQVQDKEQVQRIQVAGKIRECLHEQQVFRVRVGMSRVYTDASMIGSAFNEAIRILDAIYSGKRSEFYGCWENFVSMSELVLPDYLSLEKFEEALKNQDLEEARTWLHHIVQSSLQVDCSRENRMYIRYTVLQCLVEYLNRTNTVGKGVFLAECLQLNVGDGASFEKNITEIIKKCLETKDTNNFRQMLEYIEDNYYRSDLSYEEVAAVGKVSKSYISRIFKLRLGMSYIEYLTHVRLERACVLLRTTDVSINDIVKLIGYENSSSFRRSFKSKYGINATDYRKREKGKGDYI